MVFVSCAVLGYRTPFSILIESDMRVSELAFLIKANQPRMLTSFDHTDLILYKVDLPNDDATLEAIYQRSVRYREDQKLSPRITLGSVFGETGPLRGMLNILVEPLGGESSYPRPDRDLAGIVTSPLQTVPPG